MGKNDGDAYPDPRRGRVEKHKMKIIVCIGLLLIWICSFIIPIYVWVIYQVPDALQDLSSKYIW